MDKPRRIDSRPTLGLALGVVTCVFGSTAPPTSAQDAIPPVIELRRAETLGIGTSPLKAAPAKVGADLLALHAEYQAYLKETSAQGAAAPVFRSRNTIAPIAGGSVVIDAAASGDPETLAADLRALGAGKIALARSRCSDAWCRAACRSRPSRRSRTSPPCSSPAPPMRALTSTTWVVRVASR